MHKLVFDISLSASSAMMDVVLMQIYIKLIIVSHVFPENFIFLLDPFYLELFPEEIVDGKNWREKLKQKWRETIIWREILKNGGEIENR